MLFNWKIHFSNGNIKLGKMLTWSKLYGKHEIYVKQLGYCVVGTCGKYCNNCENPCYVRKSYRYGSVILGHARNTLAIRNDMAGTFNALDMQLNRMKKNRDIDIRIHQSGELESMAEFLSWCRLARKHPEHVFYLYTKAFDLVLRPLMAGLVPENMIVLFSVWGNYGINEFNSVKHLKNVKAFVYVDKTYNADFYAGRGLVLQTACRAYNEDGKLDHNITCDKCKKCNRINSAKIIACYEH